MQYYSMSKEEVLQDLKTSEKGLSKEEVDLRIRAFGKNQLKEEKKFTLLKIFLSQFNSFLIYILIFASFISFLIGHTLDGSVIISVVVLNSFFGFFQEYRADKAVKELKKLLVSKTRVLREGIVQDINSEELVPGDLIFLSSGDRINADCRILHSENLQVNEAVLTGESMPIDKFPERLRKNLELTEQRNILFSGTSVVNGSVKAIVVSTGMKTEFGKIAGELQEIESPQTPIQKNLDKFSKQVGLVILAISILILGLGILKKMGVAESFMVAITLAVSAIPEGLPAVLTLSFAISSLFISKKHVLVRTLPSVEALGSVTVICSDKTGTITEEKMTVQEIFAEDSLYLKKGKNLLLGDKKITTTSLKTLNSLLRTSILCNNARFEIVNGDYQLLGDPTEQALLRNSLDLGFNKKKLCEEEPSIMRFEFDSKRKMMSVLRTSGRNKVLYTKGAMEKVLQVCSSELVNGEIRKLTNERRLYLLKKSHDLENKALRVLSFAFKNFSLNEKVSENGLIFLGFLGMIDPPRPEVRQAVQQCYRAGISVKIITGDSLLTAQAIAKEIGVAGKAISERELISLSNQQLKDSLDEVSIFARITPEQKLRILQVLKEKGEIVAMTGDGINDVLALKSADIGVSMGIRGTDVAREVSDIVLLDDNFSSIVEGIKEGRRIYDNIKKFIRYLLSVNFDEILLVASAFLFNLPLPLLPLQILWINLITDSFPSLAIVFEKEENVMSTLPRREKSILEKSWKFIFTAGTIGFISSLTLFLIEYFNASPIEEARTMVMVNSILFQLFLIYSCRSDLPVLNKEFFSNKFLNYSVLISFALQILLIYSPLAEIFSLAKISFGDWLFILPFSLSGFIIMELIKNFRNNHSETANLLKFLKLSYK